MVAKFIKQVLNGETCEIYGDGSQTRDFIFIDDLVDAILKAATLSQKTDDSWQKTEDRGRRTEDRRQQTEDRGQRTEDEKEQPGGMRKNDDQAKPWGEVFQIATNREHTVNEVAELIRKILKEYGHDMEIAYGNPRIGDVLRNYSDTTKAKEILGWQFQTDLEKGLRKTIDFFMQNSNVNQKDY